MHLMTQGTTKIFMPDLIDFGLLQSRYQGMKLAHRAKAVLHDAEPALHAVENILQFLEDSPQTKDIFDSLRNNNELLGKMRASEAKNKLIEDKGNFLRDTRQKLAAWQKTMERLGDGEDVRVESGKEYIPAKAPVAMAIIGSASASNYLLIVQLALMNLLKTDPANGNVYKTKIAELRRCATVLSDCEHASGIQALVH